MNQQELVDAYCLVSVLYVALGQLGASAESPFRRLGVKRQSHAYERQSLESQLSFCQTRRKYPSAPEKKMRDIERSTASLTRGNDDCNGSIVAKYIALFHDRRCEPSTG